MNWIKSPVDTGEQAVYFDRRVIWREKPVHVEAKVTAMGVYNLLANGRRVNKNVLAPGWTSYHHRVQVQTYDLDRYFLMGGTITVEVGQGWGVGTISYDNNTHHWSDHVSAAAEITATYADGSTETVATGPDWICRTHPVLFTDIYNGETVDTTYRPRELGHAVADTQTFPAVPQIGEWIMPQERLAPVASFTAPNGERILDFGQNLTGWVELTVQAPHGSVIAFDHAEILDKDGNFYRGNYRSAKAYAKFILNGEKQVLAPHFTFYGFRYIRLLEYPFETVDPAQFTAVVVHSDMKRTGDFHCGNAMINQLYHNIIWGQKSNYLDLPTDCPQRDERLGWTGDAEVFIRTAAINYDVERFFEKWLGDMMLEQEENGVVRGVVPNALSKRVTRVSAGWGDAAVICPWELYRAYGNKELLRRHFPMMKKWVDYMHSAGSEEFLWLDGKHYGDWLALDAPYGKCKGATPTHMIATAYFAYSCRLTVRAGHELGEDVREYEELYRKVVNAFRACYIENGAPAVKGAACKSNPAYEPEYSTPDTQTARVLMLRFGLCTEEDRPKLARQLAEMIEANGGHLTTGFLGTPHLLHVLSENGYGKLAYDVLLTETFPGWLFSIRQGATTMWEHWDGVKEDGTIWPDSMNSYNHYAYGAVYDWIFGVAAGVDVLEPGYKRIRLAPLPDARLGELTAGIETRFGRVESHWEYRDGGIAYRFTVPEGVVAEIALPDGRSATVSGGVYSY